MLRKVLFGVALLGTTSVAFIDMDAYYNNYAHLPVEERRRINWDHPNSFDWELLLSHLSISYPERGISIGRCTPALVTESRSRH